MPNLVTMGERMVLALVLLTSILSPATPASGGEPKLGSYSTITAMKDGTIDIALPRDVTLPLKASTRSEVGPAPWITFAGGGRAVGIALLPMGSTDALSSGLVATQFRSCRRGCQERPVNVLMINGAVFHGDETLRAGNYRLYVFTDGEPSTIRLGLPLRTDNATIRVGGPGYADVRNLEAHIDRSEGVTAYSAGASYEMRDDAGLFMSVNVMRDENYRGVLFNQCLAPDHAVPDEIEAKYCFPTGGGIVSVHPDERGIVQPIRGGYILITFVGLDDRSNNEFNGDSSHQHYSVRIISPGPMGELWSQGILLGL